MLHDPSHRTPAPQAAEITLKQRDKDILRRLASDLADIAALPVHKEKARLWRYIIAPVGVNVNDELTLTCGHPWAREQERELRQTLYQWRHLPVTW